MMRRKPRGGPSHETVRMHSAGGVVVCRGEKGLRVAVMRSAYGTWVFPKGGVEKAEAPEDAARREVGEEIGLPELALQGPLGRTEHEFEREGRRCRKRVDWFLFEAPSDAELRPNPVQHALDGGWFSPDRALALLSHADQRRILRRALSLIGPRSEDGAGSEQEQGT